MRLVACLLLLGIAVYKFFPLSFYWSCVGLGIVVVFSIFTWFVEKIRYISFCLIIFFLGYASVALSMSNINSGASAINYVSDVPGMNICEGVVTNYRLSSKGPRLILKDLMCLKKDVMQPLLGKVRLSVQPSSWAIKPIFEIGDVVRFNAFFSKPRDFKNFNKPTFEIYCLAKGISAVGYVSRSSWIVKIGSGSGRFEKIVSDWRRVVKDAASKALKDPEKYLLVKAFLLGDMSGFEDELINDIKILGIVHLIVVSGLHVAVLAGICWWGIIIVGAVVSRFVGQVDLRPIACLLSLIIVWVFIALTGFGIPAVRSGVIATIYLGSLVLMRKHDPWDSLALSVILILIVNPLAAYDLSFQLTYASIVGLLIALNFTSTEDHHESLLRRLWNYLVNTIIISMGAFLGVFPLLAYYFGTVPIMGPFVTMILSPLVTSAIVPFSLFAAIITPISNSAGSHLFSLLAYPSGLFLEIVRILARYLSWSLIDLEFGVLRTLSLYGLVFIIIHWKKSNAKAAKIVVSAFLGLGLIMAQNFEVTEGELAVAFLDVGQGASVVLRLPNGSVTVIDGGGSKGAGLDFGKIVLEPFIKRLGVEKVDKIVVTHPHPDHFKGLEYIIENYSPKMCLVGNYPESGLDEESSNDWQEFLRFVLSKGIEIVHLKPIEWTEDGVNFSVYSPPAGVPVGWTVNDASIVMRVEYDSVSFLITGDVESQAENYLVENEFDLASTVMQVPHHGSDTSSSAQFLDATVPQYAVIQVGSTNKYGFPKSGVLERLAERNIKTYRTDQDGAVVFITDGSELKIHSALGK